MLCQNKPTAKTLCSLYNHKKGFSSFMNINWNHLLISLKQSTGQNRYYPKQVSANEASMCHAHKLIWWLQ